MKSVRVATVFFTSLLLLCSQHPVFAQSAGSGSGSFANAYLIPSIVCQAGTTSSGSSGSTNPACSSGGGPSVLYSDIKVPSASNKDVLLLASLETSLLTDTLVSSSGGNKSSSTATGSIVVTPHVFECPSDDCSGASGALVECTSNTATSPCAVFPNQVTFDERQQTLSASLAGLCTLTSGILTCTTPETIELILSTTSAHSFNFLVHNLSAGVYQVQLQVSVTTSATSNSLQAGATAMVGVGAGSLVNLLVQAQTPFNNITLCGTTSNSGGTHSCGP
jgi:hypothetical protein